MHPRTLLVGFVFLICIFNVAYSNSIFQEFWKIGNLTSNDNGIESARKKKRHDSNKYVVPLLIGSLLVKSIIFPLAFKTMAVMSGISVLLSTLSLIVTSIVAFAKIALKSNPIKVVHKIPYNSWAKDDNVKNLYGNVESYDMVAPAPQ